MITIRARMYKDWYFYAWVNPEDKHSTNAIALCGSPAPAGTAVFIGDRADVRPIFVIEWAYNL